MKTLVLLGAGGFAQTLADVVAQTRQFDRVLFLDDTKTGPQIAGTCADYLKFKKENVFIYPAFGNNEIRLKWLEKLAQENIVVPTIIHPSAYISPTATLGPGCVVLPRAVINTNCRLARGCIVNCGAVLDHDCILEEGVHLCIGALVKAQNRLPNQLKVEAGQVILNATYPL